MKRLLTVFLLLATGVVSDLAQTQDPSFKLFAVKVELSGEVKLAWTRPAGAPSTTTYEVYRAMVSDSMTFTLVTTTNDTAYIDKVPTVITTISNSYAYYVLAKFSTTIVKSNVLSLPVPGIPPVGAFRLEGNITENGKVKLEWETPPINDSIEYYLVFRVMLMNNMPPARIEKIDSTTALWSVTDIPWSYILPGTSARANYYVKAKVLGGEFLTSTMVSLTFQRPDRDEVKFVSTPPKYGQVGKMYEYTAHAVSSDPTAVIRYYGEAKPLMMTAGSGFKIDSVTGVVNWTPQNKGIYYVHIVAVSNKGGKARQEYTVTVAGGNGIVQGKVTDTDNVAIAKALIELFKTENSTSLSFTYSTFTDENGNYRINRVDPGSYKLRASAPGRYQSQWYDGKREASQADIITVADSPAVTIANFKLRGKRENQLRFTVTGRVTDTAGFAIAGRECRVVFVRAEFALNIGAGLHMFGENMQRYFELYGNGDFRLEGNSEFVFKTKPDSLGNYTLDLPAGSYIAFARAKGYETEFYYEQSSILTADIILVPDPRVSPLPSKYNFTLAPLPPVVLGEIHGAVIDSVKDIVVPARVLAFRDRWFNSDNYPAARVYITDTDSTGHYAFTELLPGKYIVMAVPLGRYAPAFYSDDTSNMRWKKATKIEINGNSVDNINIYVRPFGPYANGYTGITGSVTVNGGSGMMQGSLKAGAMVYAYRNGEIAGYAITNASGNYTISGLAPGMYSVFADKAGYHESAVMNVNVGYSSTGAPMSGSADFTLNSVLSVSLDRSVIPTEYVLHQNYPNPFNPMTTISYTLPSAGSVSLKVYDLLGKEVATLINGYQQSGTYSVTFNASTLASGVYFYRLEAGRHTLVKKMVLLK